MGLLLMRHSKRGINLLIIVFTIRKSLRALVDCSNVLIEFLNLGLEILENFREFYNRVNVSIKKKLLSSIMSEKLVFMGRKYRTPKFKEGFAFIYMSIDRLQRKKKGKQSFECFPLCTPYGTNLEPYFVYFKTIID